MEVSILGKRWKLIFCRLTTHRGECDSPNVKGKTIRVSSVLKGQEKLEIVLHELLHAANWLLFSEEVVTQLSRDLARTLWRLGVRWNDESRISP